MDNAPGLLDSNAPMQAMKELHKVNDYKVRLLRLGLVWLYWVPSLIFLGSCCALSSLWII